jgi:hypothetical protein
MQYARLVLAQQNNTCFLSATPVSMKNDTRLFHDPEACKLPENELPQFFFVLNCAPKNGVKRRLHHRHAGPKGLAQASTLHCAVPFFASFEFTYSTAPKNEGLQREATFFTWVKAVMSLS